MTDSVDKIDPNYLLTRSQPTKKADKSQKSAPQNHETDRDVPRPDTKPASHTAKAPSRRDEMMESYHVTLREQNIAELTLPNDIFGFVVERQLERLDILALKPIDEGFTAEQSTEGKEIETFFAINEEEMNKFAQKEDPNAYLESSPGSPKNTGQSTSNNQSTVEKLNQLMARSGTLENKIKEQVHQQKRASIQQAQSLKGQVGSVSGSQHVNAGKYGELLSRAKQIQAMAEEGSGTADFGVKQTKNLLQRQFEEAKATNQRARAREMEDLQHEHATMVRETLWDAQEKNIEEKQHEKKQLAISTQNRREKFLEEEKTKFYVNQVNKPDPFEEMQQRLEKKKLREEYKLVSFDYQQEKSMARRQESYQEAEKGKLDSVNEKMKTRQAKILAKDEYEMEKMQKRKGSFDKNQADDFVEMMEEKNQIWGNEIQNQNEMFFEGKRNDKNDTNDERKIKSVDLNRQALEANDESAEVENQSTHYQDDDPRAIAAANNIKKDELQEQQQEDLVNSLSVII